MPSSFVGTLKTFPKPIEACADGVCVFGSGDDPPRGLWCQFQNGLSDFTDLFPARIEHIQINGKIQVKVFRNILDIAGDDPDGIAPLRGQRESADPQIVEQSRFLDLRLR